MSNAEKLRNKILDITGEYSKLVFETDGEFIPGETHVPVSGKLIGHQEIQFAVDSCLDGWFTTGRFAEKFETEFAQYMNQRFCLLANSGSSANLLALSALTSPQLGEKQLQPGQIPPGEFTGVFQMDQISF